MKAVPPARLAGRRDARAWRFWKRTNWWRFRLGYGTIHATRRFRCHSNATVIHGWDVEVHFPIAVRGGADGDLLRGLPLLQAA